ncbi:MAG: alpha/beta hydrolase [Planctomycetaceae bacterium]
MPLDPQARDFLDKLERSRAPQMHELSPEDARALVVPLRVPRDPSVKIENRTIPGPAGELPARIYRPTEQRAALPIVLYFHGGGWVVGSITSHDALCRRMCGQSGCIVLSVDYRLAPEHKYPAAVDDAFAATRWAAAHAQELGGDPGRIAVAGDSAGGNLAAAVCLLARERGGPPLAAQLLIYPITDYMPDFESYRRNGRGYFLEAEAIAWFWQHYLANATQAVEITASPLRATDLSGLPTALILVAEYDPLLDEGVAYADRLEQAGVRVERFMAHGQIHGFMRRLDVFDQAVAMCDELAVALRRVLA